MLQREAREPREKKQESGKGAGLAVRTPRCQVQHPPRHSPILCPWVALQKTAGASINTIDHGYRRKNQDHNMSSGRSFNRERKGLLQKVPCRLWEIQTRVNQQQRRTGWRNGLRSVVLRMVCGSHFLLACDTDQQSVCRWPYPVPGG